MLKISLYTSQHTAFHCWKLVVKTYLFALVACSIVAFVAAKATALIVVAPRLLVVYCPALPAYSSLRFRRPFMLGERFYLASQTSVF